MRALARTTRDLVTNFEFHPAQIWALALFVVPGSAVLFLLAAGVLALLQKK